MTGTTPPNRSRIGRHLPAQDVLPPGLRDVFGSGGRPAGSLGVGSPIKPLGRAPSAGSLPSANAAVQPDHLVCGARANALTPRWARAWRKTVRWGLSPAWRLLRAGWFLFVVAPVKFAAAFAPDDEEMVRRQMEDMMYDDHRRRLEEAEAARDAQYR